MSNAAFNVRTEHVWKPSCRKVWRCLSFRVMTWADSCCNVSRLFKDKLGHVTYHWSFFIWRNFLGCKCEVSESQHLQAFVCRGHCYVFFCIPLRRFSGTWISYIIREESLTCIWVISDSRRWFLAFSIFYYLPLRLPLQLALAFENRVAKKTYNLSPLQTPHWKKGGCWFFSPKNPSVSKLNDPYESIHRRVAGYSAWGFWSSVDRLRRRRFWRKAFKPMAVPFWHVPLPRVKRRSCCCWNTGFWFGGRFGEGEGGVVLCFWFGGKWLMIGKDRVNDFEVDFGTWGWDLLKNDAPPKN